MAISLVGPPGPTGPAGPPGGVVSFNARTGVVTPQSGDYTKSDVGLGNVDNTSDANKPVSTAQATAINAKVANAINDGVTTVAPSQNAVFDALAGKSNTGHTHVAADVTDFNSAAQAAMTGAISSVVTTNLANDVMVATGSGGKLTNGPITYAEAVFVSGVTSPIQGQIDNLWGALTGYEPYIQPSSRGRFYRGDKTWAPMDKNAVLLDQVDNTSDLDKPISDATAVEFLRLKQELLDEAYTMALILG